MARKNLSSDRDAQELNELVLQYEALKKKGKNIYMDADELAGIINRYAGTNQFDKAQEVIDLGLRIHPKNTCLLVEQAYLMLDMENINGAKKLIYSVTEEYVTTVKLVKAEILMLEGEIDKAEDVLMTIDDAEEPDVVTDIAYLFLEMECPQRAIPWIERSMEMYGDEEELLAAMADCLTASHRFAESQIFYNKLIDSNSYYPPYWMGLAKSYFADQDFAKALEATDFALAADENYSEGTLMRAHCLFHLENEEDSIAEYQKAVEQNAIAAEIADMFIGLAYSNLNEWELAQESFAKARKVTEKEKNRSGLLMDIYCNQALCLLKLDKKRECHRLCNKMLKLYPNEVEAHLMAGRIYMLEGDLKKGHEHWQEATLQSPTAETWYLIGTFSIDANLIERACFSFEKAYALDPFIDGIADQLASLSLVLQDYKKFHKYNDLSEHPMNLEKIYTSLKEMESVEMIEEFKDLIEGLEKEKKRGKGSFRQKKK